MRNPYTKVKIMVGVQYMDTYTSKKTLKIYLKKMSYIKFYVFWPCNKLDSNLVASEEAETKKLSIL